MLRVTAACLAMATMLLGSPAVAALSSEVAAAVDPLAPQPATVPAPSPHVRIIVDWVRASHDNGGLPFFVIDKAAAGIFVFAADGNFINYTPALLGSAKGDTSAPGIGERELRAIPPAERTTPAGRFIAKFGIASGQQKVLWVDWATAVSLHPVVTGNAKERRLDRLLSETPDDNRITYGCINVPVEFYAEVVAPVVAPSGAVVYILPEERTLTEAFWTPSTP